MRVSSTSFTNQFLGEVNQLQQQQNVLQQQSSTGLKVSEPEDDPSAMAQVLNLQASSDQNTQFQSNITQLQSSATTTYSAMSALQTLSDEINQVAAQASSSLTTPTQNTAYSKQIAGYLQTAVDIGNTKDSEGNYIFGGTNISTPPFTANKDASGNITSVTYNGNTNVNNYQVSANMTVTTRVPGENTTGSGTGGLFVDSNAGADLFSHSISLLNHLNSNDNASISSTDVAALTKDESNIINQIGANSITQATLTTASSLASTTVTNNTTQISNVSSADLATTLTKLSQTQTAYQAALESGTMIFNLSILSYLH